MIEREYLALVHGRPPARAGRIEAPIGRDPAHRTRMAVDGVGARPRDHALRGSRRRCPASTLLRLRLETGRTHQIRVHLEAIGHPVVGDPVYAPASADAARPRRGSSCTPRASPSRIPCTGEPVEVESQLPADLAAALEQARARR